MKKKLKNLETLTPSQLLWRIRNKIKTNICVCMCVHVLIIFQVFLACSSKQFVTLCATKPVYDLVCLYWVCSPRQPLRMQLWKWLDVQQWESTAHSPKARRPFPETLHWAVRYPMMKILVKDDFVSLWTDTERIQKHFSQVRNIASYLVVKEKFDMDFITSLEDVNVSFCSSASIQDNTVPFVANSQHVERSRKS